MAILLKKKPETEAEIIDALIVIGSDKNSRFLNDDHIEWLERKLKEVAKLARRLKKMRSIKA